MNPQYPSGSYTPTFIAPHTEPQRKGPNKIVAILLLLVTLGIIGFGAMFVMNSQSDKIDSQKQHLVARLDTLEALLDEGSANAKSPALRKVQADASILVRGANVEMRGIIAMKKIPKDIIASEADKMTFDELKDAKLNGNFDRPYQAALSTKLESTLALLKEIHSKTKSKSLKDAASRSYDTYSSVLNQLSNVTL